MDYGIVSYERIARLLKLDEREKEIDDLFVYTANEQVSFMCDRCFALQEYTEHVQCDKGLLRLKHWPIQSVEVLKDDNGNTLEVEATFTTSEAEKSVCIDSAYDRQQLTITYTAGYEKLAMPSSLVQAVITCFTDRKTLHNQRQSGIVPEKVESVVHEVLALIEPFERKHL